MPTPTTKLLQGTLDMLILKALSLGPLHGYGIGQRIGQISDDALRVEEGSLYPALYRIERQGWITAEWGVSDNMRAKFYRLTRAGRKQLEIEEENWERLAGAVFKVLRTV
jgi:PadR family transcriptional regulator PadR